MYPYLRLASIEEGDHHKISEMLLRQPKEYIQSFRAFSFDAETIKQQLENPNNYFVLMFVGARLAAFAFIRYAKGYERPTTGNVTDISFRNNGLATLGIVWLKSFCKLRKKNSDFVAHVDEDNHASIRMMQLAGIKQIE